MAISALEALNRLAAVKTVQQLTELILSIEAEAPSGTTILYSGEIGGKTSITGEPIKSAQLAQRLTSSTSKLSIIDQTSIGKFLTIDRADGASNKLLREKLDELFNKDRNRINAYLYGSRDAAGTRSPDGIWDLLSARFVAQARGEVITLTGGARRDGVFAQVELPQLLRNPAVTSIDGIPIAELRRLSPDQAFALVTAASEQRAANLRIPVDRAGLPLPAESAVPLDSRAFLATIPGVQGSSPAPRQAYRPIADFIPPERLRQHQDDYRSLRAAVAGQLQQRNQVPDLPERIHLSRLLGRIDDGLAVYGLALAALDAKQAFDRGDRHGAQQILRTWALENAGALLAGRLVGLMAAPLVAAGPLGLLLAGGLSLGAAMAGSSAAEPAMAALIPALASWTDATISILQRLFGDAETQISPLVLDLDGNGITTRSLTGNAIHFDHDGNGFAERSGWVGAGDGLLVRDLDGNGRISNGNELFGNATRLPNGDLARNGFEALRPLDSNGDGQVDNRDSGWRSLRVWIDRNADAATDAGELLSPEAVGVSSLLLAYSEADRLDGQGNRHRQLGAYLTSSGARRELTDVWFAVDVTRTRQTAPLPVPAAIAALPNLTGMGTVLSLHQVMAANPLSPLPGLLEQWQVASSAQRAALIEPILLAWTGAQEAPLPAWAQDPRSYRRILALERLVGRPFRNVPLTAMPATLALAALERSFAAIGREFDLLLSAQVDLPPLLQRLTLVAAGSGGSRYGADAALAHLRELHGERPDGGVLVRITEALRRMGSHGEPVREALLQATAGRQDSLSLMLRSAASTSSLLIGSGTGDWIDGGNQADWIEGQDGNDQLNGWAGNDVLVGGRGNDTLEGGLGNDLYLIGRDEGDDRISDADGSPGNRDELRLVDCRAEEVQVERIGPDLALLLPGGGRVVALNHFAEVWARIEAVSFSDGTAWNEADLRARAVIGGATAGPDRLGGYNDMVNRIAGLAGDDTLLGGALADLLDGGPGNDYLVGGSGNDTLTAGGGHDTLEGGSGSDTYRIARGGWQVQIADVDPDLSSRDEVLLLERSPAEVQSVERLGDDLLLRCSGGDTLRVLNHFTYPILRVEAFRFADGSLWEEGALLERLVVGGATAGNDRLGGHHNTANRIAGLAGDDTLLGGPLADRLDGGAGNDSLVGGAGNDTLIAGGGHDTLIGGSGNDLLRISRGGWRTVFNDHDPTPGKRDEVHFTDLASTELLAVERLGNQLSLRFQGGDVFAIPHHFAAPAFRIDAFRFADGALWGESDIQARARIVPG